MFGMSVSSFVFLLVIAVVFVVGWWRIFARAGYPGIMGLAMLIPVVNAVAFLWFAFLPWPIEDALEDIRNSSEQA
jgi:hypothetical protein